MMETFPLVSVIVPVYRDEERLVHCLGGLAGQSYPRDRTELIVVDNGCERLAAALDGFPEVTVLEEAIPGSYAARNRGIRAANGTIFALTDADCVPVPHWIASGREALEQDPAIGIVGGRIEMTSVDPSNPTPVDLHERVCGLPQEEFVLGLRFAATANLFTRRSVVDKAGLFNAELKSSGDREWAMRVLDQGYEIVYADDAVVRHWARRSVRELLRRRRRITGGTYQLARLLASMSPPRRLKRASTFRHPAARLRKYGDHPLLTSRANRLRFLATETLLHGTHLLERLRLRLGGRPIRR